MWWHRYQYCRCRRENSSQMYKDVFWADSNLSPSSRIDAGLGLSWVYFKIGNMNEAIHVGGDVRHLSILHGEYHLPEIEHNLGSYLLTNGQPDRAVELWERSLQTFARASQPAEQANVLESMATYYLMTRDNPDEAENCAKRALELLAAFPQSPLRARLYRMFGQIEQNRQHCDQARSWYQVALSSFALFQCNEEIRETDDLLRSLPE